MKRSIFRNRSLKFGLYEGTVTSPTSGTSGDDYGNGDEYNNGGEEGAEQNAGAEGSDGAEDVPTEEQVIEEGTSSEGDDTNSDYNSTKNNSTDAHSGDPVDDDTGTTWESADDGDAAVADAEEMDFELDMEKYRTDSYDAIKARLEAAKTPAEVDAVLADAEEHAPMDDGADDNAQKKKEAEAKEAMKDAEGDEQKDIEKYRYTNHQMYEIYKKAAQRNTQLRQQSQTRAREKALNKQQKHIKKGYNKYRKAHQKDISKQGFKSDCDHFETEESSQESMLSKWLNLKGKKAKLTRYNQIVKDAKTQGGDGEVNPEDGMEIISGDKEFTEAEKEKHKKKMAKALKKVEKKSVREMKKEEAMRKKAANNAGDDVQNVSNDGVEQPTEDQVQQSAMLVALWMVKEERIDEDSVDLVVTNMLLGATETAEPEDARESKGGFEEMREQLMSNPDVSARQAAANMFASGYRVFESGGNSAEAGAGWIVFGQNTADMNSATQGADNKKVFKDKKAAREWSLKQGAKQQRRFGRVEAGRGVKGRNVVNFSADDESVYDTRKAPSRRARMTGQNRVKPARFFQSVMDSINVKH